MSPAPTITLELGHLRAFAAILAHGPATLVAIAGRGDIHLIELAPRTAELQAVGAVRIVAQTDHGPAYAAIVSDLNIPSGADAVERRVNALPIRDQVSLAAGIMARHARRGRISSAAERSAPQLDLTTS